MPDASTRVGIFGGTFDPPHVGHLAAARAALDGADLDGGLIFVVAGEPWQKVGVRDVTDATHRLAMVRLLAGSEARASVSDVEVRRAGPSYTADTLSALAVPGRTLVLVLGADAAAGIPTWERAADVLRLAELAVVDRPDVTIGDLGPAARITHVPMRPVDVSSTEIRARVAGGASLDDLVTAPVARYITDHGLYR